VSICSILVGSHRVAERPQPLTGARIPSPRPLISTGRYPDERSAPPHHQRGEAARKFPAVAGTGLAVPVRAPMAAGFRAARTARR